MGHIKKRKIHIIESDNKDGDKLKIIATWKNFWKLELPVVSNKEDGNNYNI